MRKPDELMRYQLAHILKEHSLPTSGRKRLLIDRLKKANPSGSWINNKDINDTDHSMTLNQGSSNQNEDYLKQKEKELNAKEIILREKEIEILQKENEMLKARPSPLTDINCILPLLNDYDGSTKDVEKWINRVKLIIKLCELDDTIIKVIIGSKLQGVALDWYRSRPEYLSMSIDEFFLHMNIRFNSSLRQFESKQEIAIKRHNESFNDNHHSKITSDKNGIVKREKAQLEGLKMARLEGNGKNNRRQSRQESNELYKNNIKFEDILDETQEELKRFATPLQACEGVCQMVDISSDSDSSIEVIEISSNGTKFKR